MMNSETSSAPYTVLAEIYDEVMSDVEYETWSDYIDEIILMHHPEARILLELACGTGTMAFTLEELDQYKITATDRSEAMIGIAKNKAKKIGSSVNFQVMDFLNPDLEGPFDVIYMTFDSLNYLHDKQQIISLHHRVKPLLGKEGIFIYDFTTPRNSRKAILFLNHEERTLNNGISFSRRSEYDAKARIHTNNFLIQKRSSEGEITSFREIHRQKIYTLSEIRALISETEFTILASYNSFVLEPASEKSLRVTMVLQ